jgi:hypothetical protein
MSFDGPGPGRTTGQSGLQVRGQIVGGEELFMGRVVMRVKASNDGTLEPQEKALSLP